jgi:hypothetical protein
MGDRSQAKAFISRVEPGEVAGRNRHFRLQADTFNLHFSCRNCVHLDPDNRLCSLEYPNEELKQAAEQGWALTDEGDLVFCKYFEVL